MPGGCGTRARRTPGPFRLPRPGASTGIGFNGSHGAGEPAPLTPNGTPCYGVGGPAPAALTPSGAPRTVS